MPSDAATTADQQTAVEAFHRAFYDAHDTTWKQTFWLGTTVRKCAFDLWTYQEIIVETRPDLIVETGTYLGGSALYMASVCDLVGHGKVVTVDGASDAMLWGAEAILRTGPDGSARAVGSLSSAAFGHTLGCPVGMALLAREDGPADAAWLEAGTYHVDLAGELLPARVHLRAPYDPASARPKA